MDDISDFEEELTSILLLKFQVQQVQVLRTMTATTAIGVKEPRLHKTVKERNLQRKIKRGEELIAKNNQSNQQASAATSMRIWNKNTNMKANRGGNQNLKTTKMLTKKELGDVMLKLEGNRPTWWNFVSGAAVSTMNHFETHRKLIEEKYSTLATTNFEVLRSTFSVYVKNLYPQYFYTGQEKRPELCSLE